MFQWKKLGLICALTALIASIAGTLSPAVAETGVASWYGDLRVTATGRSYSAGNPTLAAHKTIPLGSVVKVTRVSTGKSLTVTIIDRGPYIRGRIIDLTPAGARALGFYDSGVTKVRISVLRRGNTRQFILANSDRTRARYAAKRSSKKTQIASAKQQRRALGGAKSSGKKLKKVSALINGEVRSLS
jgi:rare lipoprotein A